MNKIRIALASALAIGSLVAAGVAMTPAHSTPRPAHHLADLCCTDDNAAHL